MSWRRCEIDHRAESACRPGTAEAPFTNRALGHILARMRSPRPEADSDSPPGIRGCRASLRIRIRPEPRHSPMSPPDAAALRLKAIVEADPAP